MGKLQRIGILFSAKLQAIFMAFWGLMAGIAYAFGGAIYEFQTGTLNSGTALAFLALIGMPVLFAAFGFISGMIGALFYNMSVKWFGGLEADFQTEI